MTVTLKLILNHWKNTPSYGLLEAYYMPHIQSARPKADGLSWKSITLKSLEARAKKASSSELGDKLKLFQITFQGIELRVLSPQWKNIDGRNVTYQNIKHYVSSRSQWSCCTGFNFRFYFPWIRIGIFHIMSLATWQTTNNVSKLKIFQNFVQRNWNTPRNGSLGWLSKVCYI